MKVTLATALVAALAASASAEPLRATTLHPAPLPSSGEGASMRSTSNQAEAVEALPFPASGSAHHAEHPAMAMPCHGKQAGTSGANSGRFAALLQSLGITSISDEQKEADHSPSAVRSSVLQHWKEHMESMLHSAEDRVIPLLEHGGVKLLPVQPMPARMRESGDRTPEIKWWRSVGKGRWLVKDGAGAWRSPREDEEPPRRGAAVHAGKMELKAQEHEHEHEHGIADHGGHRHGHHSMAKTAVGRLHRALKNLRPHESVILAFVIGAGLGSIIHLFFMLFLLSLRRLGLCSRSSLCSTSSTTSPKEDRRARRQARKAKKAEKKLLKFMRRNGSIRLEGEERVPGEGHGEGQAESLPAYEERESQRLVVEKEQV